MSTEKRTTSLTQATTVLREGLLQQVGEAPLSVLDRDAETMSAGDAFAAAVRAGDRAPTFRLGDARGGEVALEDLLAHGPVVLVFYRGTWCPYCNLQLAAFQAELAEIRAAGATLVAISPQTPDQSMTIAERHALEFPVLSDLGNAVARDYGLVYTQSEAATATSRQLGIDLADFNGDDSNTLPAASTFVIGDDGVIRFASISGDFRWRVGPAEVLAVLQG